jgi:hypothetical protein
VKANWKKDKRSLYLGGKLCGTRTFVTMPDRLADRLYIGSSAQGSLQAQAALDEFTISPKP